MKSILFTLKLIVVSTLLYGQTIEASLDSFSQVYISAVQDGDFDALVNMTHPDVIKTSGGTDYAKQDLVRDADDYNRLKLRLTSIQTKTSSKIIEAGTELHALVPYKKVYDSDGLTHEEENYYLAASLDNGASWTFLDLRKHDIESIPVFIPAYNGRLNLFLE